MNLKKFLLLILLLISIGLSAQKKPLDHSVYDGWKNIQGAQISNNGNWVNYEINPQEGDGWLYFYNAKNNALDSIARGSDASISANNDFIAFLIKPTFAETRAAKKEKKKRDEMPKNKLGIKDLKSGEINIIEDIKSFKTAEEDQSWMAYLKEKKIEKKAPKKDTTEANPSENASNENGPRGRGAQAGAPKGKTPEAKGTELVILNPANKKEYTFTNVTDYEIAKNGAIISYLQLTTDTAKNDTCTLNLFNTKTEQSTVIFKEVGTLKNLSLNNDGGNVAFIFSADTAKVKVYDLFLSQKASMANKVVNMETNGMFEGWSVSENGSLSFSENGNRLFFGTAVKPVEEPESVTETEVKAEDSAEETKAEDKTSDEEKKEE